MKTLRMHKRALINAPQVAVPLLAALLLVCSPSSAQMPDNGAAIDPLLAQLQSLQQMRGRLEQDMAQYLDEARAKSGVQPMQTGTAPEVRQMRQDVQANLQRLEDRFRCLDVDIKGNNGNVVLVCGNNHGAVSSNTQQAFGADLNVNRPAATGGGL